MKNLEPAEIWGYFDEILKIPRLSRNEDQIIDYLARFAKENKLAFKKDKAGNCLISKPASEGFDNRQMVILQSHLDMVGEKLMDVDHDFSKDPIKAKEENGWIIAEGTTLGADDGIGVAASLAILASDTIRHGPLECLFTVDEETGMTGAFGLEKGFMTGGILLNLDSEDEGEIFIGCAGGIDTIGRFKKKTKRVPRNRVALQIALEGLQGGHSGDEIHKGFGNAIKLMNRMLWNMDQRFKFHISSFEGGKLRNAIPREASALIVMKPETAELIKIFFNTFLTRLKNEVEAVEPGFSMSLKEVALPETIFQRGFQRRIMNMLYACPHGVIAWSPDIEGLVETSTNLAVIRENDNDFIEVITSQRSSRESAKTDVADRVSALFTLAGGIVKHSDGYPGWKPDKDSEILRISEKVYKKLFKKEAEIKAIHAGLECGLFLEKYPYLDMVSFGPTIKGAHTPEERLNIDSVSRFWDFLLSLLTNIPVRQEQL